MSRRRVVVTGLGPIAPCGIGKEAFWRASLEARSHIGRIRRFDPTGYRCQVAGQVEGFEARDWLDVKTRNQTDRSVHMAFACCEMAVADAGLDLDGEDATQVGMYFANQFGGMEFAEPELYAQAYLGPQRVSAYQAIAWFYAAAQGQWSIARGILGFGKTLVGDRAGGIMALAMGSLAIRQGHAQVVLAGGFEAPVVPYVWAIHQTSGLLSEHRQSPEKAYRPFDAERSGLVLGEGSAILVLEERDRALARGARIYGEVLGYALGQEPVASPLGLASASRLAATLRAGVAEARIAEIGSQKELSLRIPGEQFLELDGMVVQLPVKLLSHMHAEQMG